MRLRLLLLLFLLLTRCSGSVNKAYYDTSVVRQMDIPPLATINTTYMPTGLYFLTDESSGIKMKVRLSDEVYFIAPNAFASVNNVSKTILEKAYFKNKIYTSLRMTFDSEGIRNLKDGTGNSLHPKIAVIVANRLLYVIDNNVKTTTGVISIALLGYSDLEMKAIQNEVNNKR